MRQPLPGGDVLGLDALAGAGYACAKVGQHAVEGRPRDAQREGGALDTRTVWGVRALGNAAASTPKIRELG